MAARMMSPEKRIVLLVVGALWSTISVQTLKNDQFSEELYINSMNDGHVLSHFQFTTLWNSSIADQNTCMKTGGHLKIIIFNKHLSFYHENVFIFEKYRQNVLMAHPECFSLLLNSKFSHLPHLR